MNNTTLYSISGSPGGDSTFNSTVSSIGDTTLLPIVGTAEFPPLSQLPISPGQTRAANNPIDRYVLQRQTFAPQGQEDFKAQKDLNWLVPESERFIDCGLQQARHTHAISLELKILLENEKKILDHVLKRYERFKQLKEENKQRTEEWNAEIKRMIPQYENNLLNLLNTGDNSYEHTEGLQGIVYQKVLFEIVSRTALAAKSISTHLSMENTIVNDIALSLIDLKQHSSKMLNLVGRWLPMVDKHAEVQVAAVERWTQIREKLQALRKTAKAQAEAEQEGGMSKKQVQTLIQSYDDRIKKLEQVYGELLKTCAPSLGEEYDECAPVRRNGY